MWPTSLTFILLFSAGQETRAAECLFLQDFYLFVAPAVFFFPFQIKMPVMYAKEGRSKKHALHLEQKVVRFVMTISQWSSLHSLQWAPEKALFDLGLYCAQYYTNIDEKIVSGPENFRLLSERNTEGRRVAMTCTLRILVRLFNKTAQLILFSLLLVSLISSLQMLIHCLQTLLPSR